MLTKARLDELRRYHKLYGASAPPLGPGELVSLLDAAERDLGSQNIRWPEAIRVCGRCCSASCVDCYKYGCPSCNPALYRTTEGGRSVSKTKPPTKAQLLYAAQAVFEARVIVERHLQLPDGSLDAKLRELEMNYYRHAEATDKRKAKP